MEILMSITVGVLFMVGTYLILTKSLLRVILGLMLLSHGAHLLLLTMAGLKRGAPPLLGQEAPFYADPLPQALILTAIVISFGVTAFLLVLAYRTYKEHKTDDLDKLRGTGDE
ncbi:Na(+)/H(+) antiporter subunit C [Alkalihalophilus pseudofirmus]|uniref:Na(+)/H(+) antiporter subunit C n=1 Tax=Alkalihalobacterium alkalinitrilicum TaxID=427920 RepID=UPI00094DAC3E|nr:Na(+)/H(+) antiporter subunit C [Alkalihalobacterium alkalinitrilicum]OLO38844.1 Na(+)/H(+) antiporter subunit C [Alkalihalophilus pseudofirmus]